KAGGYKYRTYGKILSEQIRGLYNESRWDTVNEYEKDVAGVKLLITLDVKQQEFRGLNATATEVIENLTELVDNNETNVSKVMNKAGTCLRIVRKLKSIKLEVVGLTDVSTGFEDIVEEKAGNLTRKITASVDAIIYEYKKLALQVRSNFLIARTEQVNGTIEELKPEILAELNKSTEKMNTSLIQSLADKFLDARDELVEIVNKMYEVKREAEAEGFDDIKEEMSGYIADVNSVLYSVETDATNLRLFSGFIEHARESNEIFDESESILSKIKGRLDEVITGIKETGKVEKEDIAFISEKADEYLAITTHMLFLNVKLKDIYDAIDSSTTLGNIMMKKAEEIQEPILSRDAGDNRDLMVLITYIMRTSGKLLLLHLKEEKQIDETLSSFKALDEEETRRNLKGLKETLRRMKPFYNKCHGSLNFLEAKEGIEDELKRKLKEVVNLAIDTKRRYLLGKLILAQNLPATIRKILKGKRTRDEACENAITYISTLTLDKVNDMSSIGLKETDEIPTELLMSESEVKKKIAELKKTALTLSGRVSILSRVVSYLSATADSMSQLVQEYSEMAEIKAFIGEKKGELKGLKGEYKADIEKGDEKKAKLEGTLERIKDYEKQREEAKKDQEEGIEETKEKMDNFALVDEMLTKIKRGYHDAKARVYQKVDDIFDEPWSRWMRKPVKAALSGLFLGADFIIDYIVDSGWFRSFMS
ncbi:hypothetical protein GWN63_01115, partial [Candidatus Bathyarchaeota archaeon]|nr:hypothetical protein [Candidatus Bathyarchaeota archaeon]NIU80838.1 hypothetical protein [Candidatus Bathyarchaeota archaeon]NIW34116.1 hypothetical protein [Candidatus Bathyarchaeota archaeon]